MTWHFTYLRQVCDFERTSRPIDAVAIRTVNFCRSFGTTWESRRIAGQLIDSATSVAMNYRAATRGRSKAEFIAKLGTVVEEVDESVGWLELISTAGLARGAELDWLTNEAGELLRIFGSSQLTAKTNYQLQLKNKRAQSNAPSLIPDRQS